MSSLLWSTVAIVTAAWSTVAGGVELETRKRAEAGETVVVDSRFPGGNILFGRIEGDAVFLRHDPRDTPIPWFYWYFRVRGTAGRTLTFHFTDGAVVGNLGPAVSTDGGGTWRWLGPKGISDKSFTYAFPRAVGEVRFCVTIPYLESNLSEFLSHYQDHPDLRVQTLALSQKGRPIELLQIGPPEASAKYRVLLTARHHACEATVGYLLEGLMAAVLADDASGRLLRRKVAFTIVPFMDKDGVEDGDQGKRRMPYDHWLDYEGKSLYPSPRALRAMFEGAGRGADVVLDLHCPELRNPRPFIATTPDPRIAEQTSRLSQILQSSLSAGGLPYAASDNLPFGKGWNTYAGAEGRTTHAMWGEKLPGVRACGILEFPYSLFHETHLTVERARVFGADLARALLTFLEQ